MKKTNLYLFLAVAALGVMVFSAKITAGDAPAMSCCSGMAGMTTPMADATNATPDKLTTCPVSGDKLDEMGAPFVFTYKGQEVKLCCKSCKPKFDKDPDKYIAIIRAADKK
jgi:YHS domain-containing protein